VFLLLTFWLLAFGVLVSFVLTLKLCNLFFFHFLLFCFLCSIFPEVDAEQPAYLFVRISTGAGHTAAQTLLLRYFLLDT
jgi:hypothetical protein